MAEKDDARRRAISELVREHPDAPHLSLVKPDTDELSDKGEAAVDQIIKDLEDAQGELEKAA